MRKPPNPGAFVLLHDEGRWAGLVEDRGAGPWAVGAVSRFCFRVAILDLGLRTFVNHQSGILAAIIRVWDNRKVCTNRHGIADLLDTAHLFDTAQCATLYGTDMVYRT